MKIGVASIEPASVKPVLTLISLLSMRSQMTEAQMPRKSKIENVTKRFGRAHGTKERAEKAMAKARQEFFDLIEIPESELSQQTIYAECDDPEAYVASLYPKWQIVACKTIAREDEPPEWKIVIRENPEKRNFTYLNPLDGKVYGRTVAESAPEVDLARIKEDDEGWYKEITFQPDPPPRQLVPLDRLTDEDMDRLKKYLLPVKLQNRMEKPRKPKPEELER
jgi:hypothetical protein